MATRCARSTPRPPKRPPRWPSTNSGPSGVPSLLGRSGLGPGWAGFVPFLAFPVEIRKIIYTTNAIESLNYQLHKVHHYWPAARSPTTPPPSNCSTLAIRNINQKRGSHQGTGTWRWTAALNTSPSNSPTDYPLTQTSAATTIYSYLDKPRFLEAKPDHGPDGLTLAAAFSAPPKRWVASSMNTITPSRRPPALPPTPWQPGLIASSCGPRRIWQGKRERRSHGRAG